MEWAIYESAVKARVLIMVSGFDHCLSVERSIAECTGLMQGPGLVRPYSQLRQ
jgi:hypothetical protein